MNLYYTTKILFFLLFQLKDIFSTQAISLENDITKPLDKWIAKIFAIDANTACDLFATITDYKLNEFEHNLTQQLHRFQSKIYFQNVRFVTKTESDEESSDSQKSDESDKPSTPEIYWKFSENKLDIFFDVLFLEAKGTVCVRKNEPYLDFHTYIGMLNATLTAVASKSPTNPNRLKISQNMTHTDLCISFDKNKDIHWTHLGILKPTLNNLESSDTTEIYDSYRDYSDSDYKVDRNSHSKEIHKKSTDKRSHQISSDKEDDYSVSEDDYDSPSEELPKKLTDKRSRQISSAEHLKDLEKEITPLLPSMLRENLIRNEEFIYGIKEIFHAYYQPKKEIISKHPDFLNNPQQFYYLIPKINYLNFILKRIVISGLSNLDSFKIHKASGIFTHTLLVKNVEGSMTLDYRTENEAPLKMNFHVNAVFISKRKDTNCVYVQAQYHHFIRAKANTSLTSRQSEAMVHGLESAIASSILPWMEVGKVCDLESPLEEIKITNMSDWKSVKESYKGWIPFNDDINNSDAPKFPFDVFQS